MPSERRSPAIDGPMLGSCSSCSHSAALRALRGGARFGWRHALGGLLLGLCNFGNIGCYLAAHRALPAHPALVFAGMNLGVVVLGALTGVLLFRERLNRTNVAGLVLALPALALLAWG